MTKQIKRINKDKPVNHTGNGVPVFLYDVFGKRKVKATMLEIRDKYIWNTNEVITLIEK